MAPHTKKGFHHTDFKVNKIARKREVEGKSCWSPFYWKQVQFTHWKTEKHRLKPVKQLYRHLPRKGMVWKILFSCISWLSKLSWIYKTNDITLMGASGANGLKRWVRIQRKYQWQVGYHKKASHNCFKPSHGKYITLHNQCVARWECSVQYWWIYSNFPAFWLAVLSIAWYKNNAI